MSELALKIICHRCGKPFKPWKIKTTTMHRMCQDCACRNLFDAFNFPTPPELLDRWTKVPTLSEREYRREITKEIQPEIDHA